MRSLTICPGTLPSRLQVSQTSARLPRPPAALFEVSPAWLELISRLVCSIPMETERANTPETLTHTREDIFKHRWVFMSHQG